MVQKKENQPFENCLEIWTVDDVARFLRVPKKSVYLLAQKGEIPCAKFGKHWRFCREVIEEWLKRKMLEETKGQLEGQTENSQPKPADARSPALAAESAAGENALSSLAENRR